jgi:hypothetical protein
VLAATEVLSIVAAESTIDPMHQFQIDSLVGDLAGNPFAFTNSALWMMIVLGRSTCS